MPDVRIRDAPAKTIRPFFTYRNLGKKPGYALTGQSAFGVGFKK